LPQHLAAVSQTEHPMKEPFQASLSEKDCIRESVPKRKRLSAIAKIKQDLAWRSVTGVPKEHIVLTPQQELVAEFERFRSQGGERVT
jgi:hypothetical protein